MRWRFNDGTVADVGGRIASQSAFACDLRELLERSPCGVQWGPSGHGAWLDVNDPALFDAWLRQEMGRPYRSSLKLVGRPADVPLLPEAPLRELPPVAIA